MKNTYNYFFLQVEVIQYKTDEVPDKTQLFIF